MSLQTRTEVDDGAGGATVSWTEVAEVWAKVLPMRGRERQQSMRNEAQSDYLISIRRRDVTNLHRIVWQERVLNVRFVREAGPRDHYLEIEAELGAAS